MNAHAQHDDQAPDASPKPRVLVINDGGLPALVASMIELERAAVLAWLPPGIDEQARGLVREQADLLSYENVVASQASAERPAAAIAGGLGASVMLLRAMADGVASECDRVVWPIVSGGDLDEMNISMERASLAGQLACVDLAAASAGAISAGPDLVTPLLDLTPAQVLELADDLGVPPGATLEYPGPMRGLESADAPVAAMDF